MSNTNYPPGVTSIPEEDEPLPCGCEVRCCCDVHDDDYEDEGWQDED